MIIAGAVAVTAPFDVYAGDVAGGPPPEARTAEVVFLGEQHDNPGHHAVQAQWVAELAPRVLVFEMLTKDRANRVTSHNRNDAETLGEVLEWEEAGWPDFSMYYPIFEAAPNASILGAAVPRDVLRDLMEQDVSDVVSASSVELFALEAPLPEDQQAEREKLQGVAHCDAMPADLLPRMVQVQRVRDAVLAHTVLQALDENGGPVVVITGNGHAREDWGAPFLLRQAAPDVKVFTLGQGEAGRMPSGGFSAVLDGPPVDRGDPCDAFK